MTIACPDCGSIQDLPPLPRHGLALCWRCGRHLARRAGRSKDASLACALAALLLLIPANSLPLIGVSILGDSHHSTLVSGPVILWEEGWQMLALLVAAFTVVLPFLRFGLLTAVLIAVRLGRSGQPIGRLFRWARALHRWAMPDVFLIAGLVGYSRLIAVAPTTIGLGGWCLVAAAFLAMIGDATLDCRAVWRAIAPEPEPPTGPSLSCTVCEMVLPADQDGQCCPRCGAHLTLRKPGSLTRTMALTGAALVLYGPANSFPMTDFVEIDGTTHHTILSGINSLIAAHLWPLFKLVGLSWLVLTIRLGKGWALPARTRLYRFIQNVGRWSNIDVFTIAVSAPLLQSSLSMAVRAGSGANYFILVVVLTMLAADSLDPRLMWDAAEAQG